MPSACFESSVLTFNLNTERHNRFILLFGAELESMLSDASMRQTGVQLVGQYASVEFDDVTSIHILAINLNLL